MSEEKHELPPLPDDGPELDTTNLPEGWSAEYRGTEWNGNYEMCYYTYSLPDADAYVRPGDPKYKYQPMGLKRHHYWELIPPPEPEAESLKCPTCGIGMSVNFRDGKPYDYCPDHGEPEAGSDMLEVLELIKVIATSPHHPDALRTIQEIAANQIDKAK